MHKATVLRQVNVALTREISILPAIYAPDSYQSLRRRRRVDPRQCTPDQIQE